MASNSFGTLFRITTWGESHGTGIGCVIDGCPAGLIIDVERMNRLLLHRSPGRNSFVSPRKEQDTVEILSGVFESKTTGAPISLFIRNRDCRTEHYEHTKDLLRPGHANFTYLSKYGIFDWRGGGRASARETACRVAASAVADSLLLPLGIHVVAHLKSLGSITSSADVSENKQGMRQEEVMKSPLFCLDSTAEQSMEKELLRVMEAGDSVGGSVEVVIYGCPAGLGDPIYEKLEAKLASAMMSIPASKAFEVGDGVLSAREYGSTCNDSFTVNEGDVTQTSNHAGGLLGGITTGQPVVCRIYFKPTSSIRKVQETVTIEGKKAELTLHKEARHDPCLAIRAVSVCQAMAKLVVADALLMQASLTVKDYSGLQVSTLA